MSYEEFITILKEKDEHEKTIWEVKMKNTCLKTLVASNVQIYEIEYCNEIKDLK